MTSNIARAINYSICFHPLLPFCKDFMHHRRNCLNSRRHLMRQRDLPRSVQLRAWGNSVIVFLSLSFVFLLLMMHTMAATVSSLFSLNGRTALVTGGTRGIGQAMAFALAEAGADIVLVQRDSSNTATKDEIINRLGRKAHIHVAELSDRKAVKEIIPAVTRQGFKPDILLNCAGIQRRHPSEKFPDEDWDEVSTYYATT